MTQRPAPQRRSASSRSHRPSARCADWTAAAAPPRESSRRTRRPSASARATAAAGSGEEGEMADSIKHRSIGNPPLCGCEALIPGARLGGQEKTHKTAIPQIHPKTKTPLKYRGQNIASVAIEAKQNLNSFSK